MERWTPSRSVLVALFVMLALWISGAFVAVNAQTVAAWTGEPNEEGVVAHLVCNAETERCSFIHVLNEGNPELRT